MNVIKCPVPQIEEVLESGKRSYGFKLAHEEEFFTVDHSEFEIGRRIYSYMRKLHTFRVLEPSPVSEHSRSRGCSGTTMVAMTDSQLTKPEIEFPDEPAPAELQITDITVGSGDEALATSTVEVHYLGVDYESGEEFDSSWSRGETINFPLRSLIQGWQVGIPGMKVGGRRQLTVPPAQAYGDSGMHPLAGKTLIFVIDLVGVS